MIKLNNGAMVSSSAVIPNNSGGEKVGNMRHLLIKGLK
jgi:hypothetical protein